MRLWSVHPNFPNRIPKNTNIKTTMCIYYFISYSFVQIKSYIYVECVHDCHTKYLDTFFPLFKICGNEIVCAHHFFSFFGVFFSIVDWLLFG